MFDYSECTIRPSRHSAVLFSILYSQFSTRHTLPVLLSSPDPPNFQTFTPSRILNDLSNEMHVKLTSVEASLRLDAVASAGFGLSRSKMVTMVESGSVMVDWKPMLNPAYSLQVINELL
jgi:hypothetical protein